jgi:hypothetical protein
MMRSAGMEEIRSFYRRHPIVCLAAGLVAVCAVALMLLGEAAEKAGLLIFGAVLSVGAGLTADLVRRPRQARDLALALYVELADRVARCCYDFETVWQHPIRNPPVDIRAMNAFRLRKFAPLRPIIYSSAAGQLAMLEREAPQALVHFYYRLEAWQRDLENIAKAYENKEAIGDKEVTFLAHRLGQTLSHGLAALEALGTMVGDHADLDARAIESYDRRAKLASEGSLRDRIRALISRL